MVALLDSIAPIRSPCGRPKYRPAKLHADKAYDVPALRKKSADAGSRCGSPARRWTARSLSVGPCGSTGELVIAGDGPVTAGRTHSRDMPVGGRAR
jgi:hypothetical protein